MAARRLVMVLLVLLIVSTFAATLVPPPENESEEPTTTTRTTTTKTTGGELIRETVSADAERAEQVSLEVGDQLELRVTSDTPREIEIPGLGEWDEVDEFAPAIFDLLADQADTYLVRVVGSDEVIARIVVSECCRTSRRSAGTSR